MLRGLQRSVYPCSVCFTRTLTDPFAQYTDVTLVCWDCNQRIELDEEPWLFKIDGADSREETQAHKWAHNMVLVEGKDRFGSQRVDTATMDHNPPDSGGRVTITQLYCTR